MARRLRISLNVDQLAPDQADMVLAELGEHLSYNVERWDLTPEGTAKPLMFGGERVGQWKVVDA